MTNPEYSFLLKGVARIREQEKDERSCVHHSTRTEKISNTRRSAFTVEELAIINDADAFLSSYVQEHFYKGVVDKFNKLVEEKTNELGSISFTRKYQYFNDAISQSFHEMISALALKDVALLLGLILSWDATGSIGFLQGPLSHLGSLISAGTLSQKQEVHYHDGHSYIMKFPSTEGGPNDVYSYCPNREFAVSLIDAFKQICAEIKMEHTHSATSSLLWNIHIQFEKSLFLILNQHEILLQAQKVNKYLRD